MLSKPVIYRYTDYRDYLKDVKSYYEVSGQKLSFSSLGGELGGLSRTKVRKLFSGDIRLPRKTMEQLGRLFELSVPEQGYLDLLRKFHQTEDAELALGLYRKIVDERKSTQACSGTHELDERQLKLLERWYYLPLLSYFDLKNASMTPFAIVKDFKGQLAPEQVEEAISRLVELGLIVGRPDGTLGKAHERISLMGGIPRALVKRFHQMMIAKAQESIYGVPEERRFLIAGTLTVKREALPSLKRKISEFMLSVNEEFSVSQADELCQLNVQLFPMAVAPEGASVSDD